jgi:hypothetical protein
MGYSVPTAPIAERCLASFVLYNNKRDYHPVTGRYIESDAMSVGEHVGRYFAIKQLAMSEPNPASMSAEALANRQALSSLTLELNSYAYVANNPLHWVDPTGEAGWAGFGVVVGGTIGGFYCYKKGIEKCQKAFPNHKDMLHPDRKKFLSCISGVTGVIALGIGWTTDPVGASVGEVGARSCGTNASKDEIEASENELALLADRGAGRPGYSICTDVVANPRKQLV